MKYENLPLKCRCSLEELSQAFIEACKEKERGKIRFVQLILSPKLAKGREVYVEKHREMRMKWHLNRDECNGKCLYVIPEKKIVKKAVQMEY